MSRQAPLEVRSLPRYFMAFNRRLLLFAHSFLTLSLYLFRNSVFPVCTHNQSDISIFNKVSLFLHAQNVDQTSLYSVGPTPKPWTTLALIEATSEI